VVSGGALRCVRLCPQHGPLIYLDPDRHHCPSCGSPLLSSGVTSDLCRQWHWIGTDAAGHFVHEWLVKRESLN
jgi:hypothetical protein